MALTIKAVRYKGVPPAQEISAQFDEHGGSIGRSPDNHLVLPDPEKFISRLHARIIFQGGQYFIQDTSTGGTYLGPNQEFLHHGQASLVNGEQLRIGEYELLVSIGAIAQADVTPSVESVRQLEMADSGLLENPFAGVEKPVSTDFFNSFVDQPESAVFRDSFIPPEVVPAPKTPQSDDLDVGDLLSSLESLPGAGDFPKPELPELPDDFFADEAISDQSPAALETSARPDVVFKESETPQPFQDVPDLFKPFEETGDTDVAVDPFAEAQKQKPSVVSASRPVEAPNPVEDLAQSSGLAEMPPVRPQPKEQKAQEESKAAAVSDSELFRQFLAGAGITDTSIVPPDQWPEVMKISGELLRSMVEGLMLVLRARAEMKSQFRVSVTTMRSMNNNPLKFTPSVDDAIKLMLAPTHPGFLGPKEAVREGFNDIMNHQMAMTAGIQAALSEVLRSFDPELIEKAQTEGVLFQKKTKCWERYTETYPQLKASAQEEFFGEAFADAYEKQMLLLSSSVKST